MSEENAEVRGMNLPQVDWTNNDSAVKEIQAKHEPVNYRRILGDARALLLGENHLNSVAISKHLIEHIQGLKEARITHYAIEAPAEGNNILERLYNREEVDLSQTNLGPGFHEERERVVREMAKQGIRVVAVDLNKDLPHTAEGREAH